MIKATAQACVQDVISKIKKTGEFGSQSKEKVVSVYSEEDLFDKMKLVEYPAVGVMYEGTRRQPNDKSTQGVAGELTVALVLLMSGKSVGGLTNDNEAARLLDKLRIAFRDNCGESLTGHKWVFVNELPASTGKSNLLMYVQRWSTSIILA